MAKVIDAFKAWPRCAWCGATPKGHPYWNRMLDRENLPNYAPSGRLVHFCSAQCLGYWTVVNGIHHYDKPVWGEERR